MNISLSSGPLVPLVAGVLVPIVPWLLSYVVAAYLIVAGLPGLFNDMHPR